MGLWMRRARHAVALVLFGLLLAACGGGGGGSDSGAGPGTGGPGTGGGSGGSGANPGTGLIPNAPTPGAVLVADGRTLRPLLPGALWIYRESAPFRGDIEVRVTHTSNPFGGVDERRSDEPDELVKLSPDFSGNVIANQPLIIGARLSINVLEAPAVLRANEQFLVFDARIVNAETDFDGDGRSDGADLAIWRRVVGVESVTVPASPQPVEAVRVDDFAVIRTVPSAGGAPQRIEVRGSTWYAVGLGVVRTVAWKDSTATVADSDERLIGFDGITRGFGVVMQPPATAFDGGIGPVVALPDGALQARFDGARYTIVRFDRSGRPLRQTSVVREGQRFTGLRFLPTSAGMRIVSGEAPEFVLDSLDANDALLGAAPLRNLSFADSAGLGGSELAFASHAGSGVIWAVQTRVYVSDPSNGAIGRELVVRRHAPDGTALGAPLQLAPGLSLSDLRLTAHADGVAVLVRERPPSGGERMRLVEIANDGRVVVNRNFDLGRPDRFGTETVRLLIDGAARWLAWRPARDASSGAPEEPRALRLDAAGTPVGVVDGSFEAATAAVASPMPSVFHNAWTDAVTAAGGRWWLISEEFAPLYDGAQQAKRHLTFASFDPGSGAVTGALRSAGVLRIDALLPGAAAAPIVFDDRVLLFVEKEGRLRPLVIWR